MYSSIHYLFAFVLLLSLQFHKQRHRERWEVKDRGSCWTKALGLLLPSCRLPPDFVWRQSTQQTKLLLSPFLSWGWWKSFVSPKFLSVVIYVQLMWWGHWSIPMWWGALPSAEAKRKAGLDGEEMSTPQAHHLPFLVCFGGAGFCEQEEWAGWKSTCTMNRFRFTISICNPVWGLQGKWEIVLKEVGGKSRVERHLLGILPLQARLPMLGEMIRSDRFPVVAQPWQLTVPTCSSLITCKVICVDLNCLHD